MYEEIKPDEVPSGIFPIALTNKHQVQFQVVINQDVSEHNPIQFISAVKILNDIEKNKENSPFYTIRDELLDTAEDVVISYDPNGKKFGKNFFVCVSRSAKSWLLEDTKSAVTVSTRASSLPVKKSRLSMTEKTSRSQVSVGTSRSKRSDTSRRLSRKSDEDEEVPYIPYSPPIPKEWIGGGSENEIDEEIIKETRPRLVISLQKELQYYDREKVYELFIRHVNDSKTGYVDYPPYEDKNFALQRLEIDKDIQAANLTADVAVQTNYVVGKNVWVQKEPHEMSKKEINEIVKSGQLKEFLNKVMDRLLLVLQQNELVDVFEDEWDKLGPVEFYLYGKITDEIKEYQSFTDLNFSKDKLITCIVWHPTISGIIALSCIERLVFDTRIDKFSKLLMHTSVVIIWSLKDPIHPQLLLVAPEDVMSIAFNPLAPHLIVGGCSSGQICLWDLTEYMEKLRQQKPAEPVTCLPNEVRFVDPPLLVPSIRYAAVTAVEYSHKGSVEDIHWVPDQMQIESKGATVESKYAMCYQIMSCGLDCVLNVWDIRPDMQPPLDPKVIKREREFPVNVPTTYQFLDNVWKPIHSCELKAENKADQVVAIRFSMHEKQVYRVPDKPFTLSMATSPLHHQDEERKPKKYNTNIYIGTLDGKVTVFDWVFVKNDDNRLAAQETGIAHNAHAGPVTSVEYSPFFRNIILTVGMWRFAIWTEEQKDEPIILHRTPSKRHLAGTWSTTRPGVFFLTKEDGALEVWDLTDRSHEPIINYKVSSASLTAISVHPNPHNHKEHMLAVADSMGTLHLLILPPYLTHPVANEFERLSDFFKSEVECIEYRLLRKRYYISQKSAKTTASAKEILTTKFHADVEAGVNSKLQLLKEYKKMERTCLEVLGLAPPIDEEEEELNVSNK